MFLRAFLPLIPKNYIVIERKLEIIVREQNKIKIIIHSKIAFHTTPSEIIFLIYCFLLINNFQRISMFV